LEIVDVIAPSIVFVTVALIVLVWSAADGQLRRPGMLRVQALAMVGFGALSLAGLAVDPDLGRYLVAAGWLSMASGTSSTCGSTRSWCAPMPSGAASSIS
jgi:hypothetical protein